jgi:hypothetical protein
MSRPKPKGGGGRNAVTQDLIRDNLEELDMDPFMPSATDDISSSELYPQIPPPLSASLMTAETAQCVMKSSYLARRFKLSAYFLSKHDKPTGVIRRYNEPAAQDSNLSIKQMVHTTSKPCLYFPEEILVGFGVSGVGRKRAANGSSRPRSGSAGNDFFGRLEKREKLTAAEREEREREALLNGVVLDLDGVGALAPDGEGAREGDAEGEAREKKRSGSGDEGISEDEEQEDEYALDDDYGQAHGMSDDDGGGGDDDDGGDEGGTY